MLIMIGSSGDAPHVSATALHISTAKSNSVPVKLSGEYSKVTLEEKFFSPSFTISVPLTARSVIPCLSRSKTTRLCNSEVEL